MALKEEEKTENEKLNSIIQEPSAQENKEDSENNEQVETKPLESEAVENTEQNEDKTQNSNVLPIAQSENKTAIIETESKENAENSDTNKPILNEQNNDLVTVEEAKKPLKIEETHTEISKISADNTIQPVKNNDSNGRKVFKIFESIIIAIITLIVLAFTIFTLTHSDNSIISSGITILGVDVAGLTKEAATDKIANYVQDSLSNNKIVLKHNEFEANIGPEQIETKVYVADLIDSAFEKGSGNNIFSNSFKKLSLMLNPIDIKPEMSINKEQLETTLNDISTQLPDAIKQSDYYIDGKNLIVTSGKSGVIIDVPTMSKEIISKLNDLSYINNPIEIVTISKEPDAPNIENIYKEIHKEASDAHFDAETRVVYPEENGLDFNISLDEAKAILNEQKDEYTIPLKVLQPNVTTNMIGMEAFPDLISSFSTRYPASNRDRTTNLRLAASKVNGTVVLPGETFSYNSVVGERTIAAGYREAAIYQDGQVVQRIRWWNLPNIFYFI